MNAIPVSHGSDNFPGHTCNPALCRFEPFEGLILLLMQFRLTARRPEPYRARYRRGD